MQSPEQESSTNSHQPAGSSKPPELESTPGEASNHSQLPALDEAPGTPGTSDTSDTSDTKEVDPTDRSGCCTPLVQLAEPVPSLSVRAGAVWKDFRFELLDACRTLDKLSEEMVTSIAKKLKPHEEFLSDFFGPTTAGAVGYAVFALFSVFGVVTLSRKSAADALMEDVSNSMANPYFLLSIFLTSLAFVIGSGTGENFISRYIVAPFLDLTEHVLMLAVGVVVAYCFVDLVHEVKRETVLAIIFLPPALSGIAFLCLLAKRFCRGAYAAAFEKLHRRVLIRVLGGIFAVVTLHQLVHFQDLLPLKQRSSQTDAPKTPSTRVDTPGASGNEKLTASPSNNSTAASASPSAAVLPNAPASAASAQK